MSPVHVSINKLPPASRQFQRSVLKSIETRFQELAQGVCGNEKQVISQLFRLKELLLDIRHVVTYQSFDQDISCKLTKRSEAIIAYIHAFMDTMEQEGRRNVRVAS